MKKLLLGLAMVAGFAFVSKAQEAVKANPNAPEMKFDKDVHDFGTFKKGGNGTYEFKFKNTGKEPLIIANAQGSCGCTVPQWPHEPIKAGGTAVIKVTYDTQRIGQFTKTVTISSNAASGTKILTIKGNIEDVPAEQTSPEKSNTFAPLEKKAN